MTTTRDEDDELQRAMFYWTDADRGGAGISFKAQNEILATGIMAIHTRLGLILQAVQRMGL